MTSLCLFSFSTHVTLHFFHCCFCVTLGDIGILTCWKSMDNTSVSVTIHTFGNTNHPNYSSEQFFIRPFRSNRINGSNHYNQGPAQVPAWSCQTPSGHCKWLYLYITSHNVRSHYQITRSISIFVQDLKSTISVFCLGKTLTSTLKYLMWMTLPWLPPNKMIPVCV